MRRLLRQVKRSRQPQSMLELRGGPSAAEPDTVMPEPTETRPPEPTEGGDEGPHGPNLIEELPAEVRRHILSVMGFDELKVFVRASPVFHQQYQHDRAYVLSCVLENELQSVTVDAYAVNKLTSMRDPEMDIAEFLTQTYAQRAVSLRKVPGDEVMEMVRFFLAIRAVIPRVMSFCLDENLDTGASPTEFMRLARSMYRFQLLCLVADPLFRAGSPWRQAAVKTLVELFEPWEVEELITFFQYAEEQYEALMESMHEDLPPDTEFNPWEEELEPLPCSYPQSLALRGLKLLRDLPNQPYEEQVAVVREQVLSFDISVRLDGLPSPFTSRAQRRRRRRHPSERDRLMAARIAFPFPGDRLPDDKLGVDKLPPVAWTMFWKNTYSNLFGGYTGRDFRRWGYVFWDDDTVSRLGGERVLLVQLDQNWGGRDPRDMIT